MAYRLAIFDFDGTLADSVPWFAGVVNQLAARYGFKRVEERDHETLRGYAPRRLLAVLGVPLWKVPLIAYHLRTLMTKDIDQISLFDGVDTLLRRLSRAHVALAVVSSNSYQNVRRILGPDNVGLIDAFSCGVSIFGKAAKLRDVLGACGVPRSEAIYIGDEVRDIEAAREAEVASGAVSWGYNTVASLRVCAPNEIFSTIDDIVETIIASRGSSEALRGPHQS
jgi:phosphoglycolate phosphatase